MGTPLYMAPEQFLDRVDKRSDIYSLGIMLYQMLSDTLPFQGDGIGFQHLNDPVPPLRTQGIPPIVERVVFKALAKRPEARFQTAQDLAVAFREAVTIFARHETQEAYRAVRPINAVLNDTTPINSKPKLEDSAIIAEQAQLSEIPVIDPLQFNTDRVVRPVADVSVPANPQWANSSPLLDDTTPLKHSIPPATQPLAPVAGSSGPIAPLSQPATPGEPTSTRHDTTSYRPYLPLGQVSSPLEIKQADRLPPPRSTRGRRLSMLLLSLLIVLLLIALFGTLLFLNLR